MGFEKPAFNHVNLNLSSFTYIYCSYVLLITLIIITVENYMILFNNFQPIIEQIFSKQTVSQLSQDTVPSQGLFCQLFGIWEKFYIFSSETPYVHQRPPYFHWRPPDFHWRFLQLYWRPPDFYWRPLDFHQRSSMKIWGSPPRILGSFMKGCLRQYCNEDDYTPD